MKWVLRAVRRPRATFRVIDFVDGLRLVEEGGFCDRLLVSMARMMELLTRMGVHFHTREGKRWGPGSRYPESDS